MCCMVQLIASLPIASKMKLKCGDNAFDEVFHHLCCAHLHQGSLIRGEGLWEPQGCAHDKGFRRFTSKMLDSLATQEETFVIHRVFFSTIHRDIGVH